MNKVNKIFGIVGPTASGKTKIALELAEKFPIEIISCDSMQVYIGMDIGTAKPSKKVMKSTPHHMINVVSPEKEFSAAEYSRKARKITKEIISRGNIPLLVGGSGLYFNAYIDGIFPQVDKDEKLRKKLRGFAKQKGNKALHQKLEEIDPKSANKIHPNDARRVVRALEVYHMTGETISKKKHHTTSIQEIGITPFIYGLRLPRDMLYNNINKRVDELINKGLIEEAKEIKESKQLSKTSKMAIGYKEIFSYLEGEKSREEAIDKIKQYTRNFARRQMTWFKNRNDVKWIELKSSQEREKAVEVISSKINSVTSNR